MNKALDPDFRAKYSDEGYEQATATKLTFRCRDCSTEYDKFEIRIVKAIKIRLFSKKSIPKIKHGKDS